MTPASSLSRDLQASVFAYVHVGPLGPLHRIGRTADDSFWGLLCSPKARLMYLMLEWIDHDVTCLMSSGIDRRVR